MSEQENATLVQPEAQDAQVEAEPAAEAAAPEPALQRQDQGQDQRQGQDQAELAESQSPESPQAVAPPDEAAATEPKGAQADEFESLLDSYPQYSQPSSGTVMKGQVLRITGSEVIVDVGYKCEGAIPAEEFKDSQGNLKVKPGDEIEVLMESTEERDGYVTLSYAKARRQRAWSDIESAFQKQAPITGVVVEKTKGGLAVDIGMRAFLPGSQIDVRPVRNLDALMGQEISCRIIKVNRKRGNIVVSRKALLEEEAKTRKSATLEKLHEGAVLTGTVKNLTEYGAFVDLGGIDGLLHITDMSWGRVANPSEVVSVGQEIQVKVLKFDPEKERVSLGLKQLTEDPWAAVADRYQAGSRVAGKVLNVTDYGAFVELEPGIEGLVHVSEMSWSKRLKHPSKIVSKGDPVNCQVLEVNARDRRISLGLKQLEPNPWANLAERYAVSTVISGRVRNLTDFGAFVEVEDGVDGLVHVSDLSWTQRVKHPSEVLKKGETIQAMILSIDPENRRLSLGIKQLTPDSWQTFCNSHVVGDAVKGKIARKTTFGLFIELAEGMEGLCHISEIAHDPAERKKMPLEIGEEHEFKILKMSPQERKIGLSLKAMQPAPPPRPAPEAREHREPRPPRQPKPAPAHTSSSSGGSSAATLGEMVAMKERTASRN
jgi:small subunit ribosomal protein S1